MELYKHAGIFKSTREVRGYITQQCTRKKFISALKNGLFDQSEHAPGPIYILTRKI